MVIFQEIPSKKALSLARRVHGLNALDCIEKRELNSFIYKINLLIFKARRSNISYSKKRLLFLRNLVIDELIRRFYIDKDELFGPLDKLESKNRTID